MFPIEEDAGDGWEELGADLEDAELEPQSRPLPVMHVGIYYDSEPLNGVGDPASYTGIGFGATEIIAVRRRTSAEVRLRLVNVFGAVLLDTLVIPPVFVPCKLTLTIYDDDRITERWSVGTDPEHAAPYLMEPERYAEQELDVAEGAATLGTVGVTIIDPATTPGDQDSGWTTEKLRRLGLADIAGRRARLTRGISEVSYVVIADGPAGTPKLDDSYAAFGFDIRDTRETERKFRLFDNGGGLLNADGTLDYTGAKSVLPDAVWGGYGADLHIGYLIAPADPLLGVFHRSYGEFADVHMGAINLLTDPGNSSDQREISIAAYAAMQGSEVSRRKISGGDYLVRFAFPKVAVLWRDQGSDDAWTEIGPEFLSTTQRLPGIIGELSRGSLTRNLTQKLDLPFLRGIVALEFGDTRGDDNLPADGQDIEFVVISRAPPSADLPVYVSGMAAGIFVRNVYAGYYSLRDEAGAIVPTGILYDDAALGHMTDPVQFRLFEPITDARDWLEKHIYAPTGWVPALDDIGRVSPISQDVPDDSVGLVVVNNTATEAAPNWNAGERIINVVSYTYQREYRPADPDNAMTADGLSVQEVLIEYQDAASVERNGRQVLELDGKAFSAIGDATGEPSSHLAEIASVEAEIAAALAANNAVLAASWTVVLNLILAQTPPETGATLAQERGTQMLNRYSLGAPTMSVAVLRSAIPNVRAGHWVLLDLSWFPDYVTGRRGLIGIAQIIVLGDLDCTWRQVTVEQVTPLIVGS